MKINKTLLFAFAVLLIAGIFAIAHLNQNTPTPSRAEAESLISKSMKNGLASNEDAKLSTRNKIRSQKIPKDQELLNKYGEYRTNLSRKLSDKIISMLDESLQMAEAGQEGRNGRGGQLVMAMSGGGIVMSALNSQLQLSQEQQDKISKSYSDYQKRQLEKTKETVERLKKDPSPLMSLMLANDASARGEIQDKEYTQLKSNSEKALEGAGNPLGMNGLIGMGSSDSPLKDDTFLAEYQSQLNPEQLRKFDESIASDTATHPSGFTSLVQNDISDMPEIELEQLDTHIDSSQKIITGMKSMMEGLGGRQNFGQQLGQ